MPLDDRNYMRGSHPPACTCVSCVARRGGYQPGRQVWRGRDITSRPSGRTRPEPANTVRPQGRARPNRAVVPGPGRRKSGGKLMKLVAVIVVAILLWAGLGVWQDFQEQGNLGPERAVAVALNRVITIPSSVVGLIAEMVNASNGRSSLPGEERSQGVRERNRPETSPANSMSEPARELLVAPTEALLPAVLAEPISERTLAPALEPAVAVTVVPEPTAANVPPTVTPIPPSSFAFLVNHPETGVEVALTREQFDEFLATGKMPVTIGFDATPHSTASRPEPTLTSTLIPAPTPRPTLGPVTQTHQVEEMARLVHQLTNEERREHGLGALEYDAKLASIAKFHSEDMADFGYFSHTNLAGESPTDRGTRQGYDCRKDYGSYFTFGLAENIFQGGLYGSTTNLNGVLVSKDWYTLEEIAEITVNGWMNSPGHRANILDSSYDKEGIGVAVSSDERVYFTQNFC